jgi:hypothetical protein
LKLRSVNNIVIAPANTGNDKSKRNTVISTAHTKSGNLCINNPGALILKIVTMKLIDPKIELVPERWKLKIAKSTEGPECAWIDDNGGYTVHPVPAPVSTNADNNNIINEGGSNQKLILFIRGNAISGAPIKRGTNQLPNPPIKIGITMKKIIKIACAVIITL